MDRTVPDGGHARVSGREHRHVYRPQEAVVALLASGPGEHVGVVPHELSCRDKIRRKRNTAMGLAGPDLSQTSVVCGRYGKRFGRALTTRAITGGDERSRGGVAPHDTRQAFAAPRLAAA